MTLAKTYTFGPAPAQGTATIRSKLGHWPSVPSTSTLKASQGRSFRPMANGRSRLP